MSGGPYSCPACGDGLRMRTHAEREGEYETRMFNSPMVHILNCPRCGDWQFVCEAERLGRTIEKFTRDRLRALLKEL